MSIPGLHLSIQLNSAGDTSLGRYNKNPKMRIQKAENVNKALEFINSRGVKLTNIGSEGQSHSQVLIVYHAYNVAQISSTAT